MPLLFLTFKPPTFLKQCQIQLQLSQLSIKFLTHLLGYWRNGGLNPLVH